MNTRIVVVDLLEEKGHIAFVKKTLFLLSLEYDVLFISSSRYVKKIGFHNSRGVDDNLFKFNTKYEYFLAQSRVIKKICHLLLSIEYSKVLITSFENITFSLYWNKLIKSYAYLHNNLERNFVSMFFFRRIVSSTTFIAFEEYMRNFHTILKNRLEVVPHPLSAVSVVEKNVPKYIFAPNLRKTHFQYSQVINFAKENGMILYMKGNNQETKNNIIIRSYFTNYYYLLSNARLVILDIPYNYRVSNILYESLSLNKNILVLDNYGLFIEEMKQHYPENIQIGISNFFEKDYLSNKEFIIEHSDKKILEAYGKFF